MDRPDLSRPELDRAAGFVRWSLVKINYLNIYLANEIHFSPEPCNDETKCKDCIFFEKWHKLDNKNDKKMVLSNLISRKSNRISICESDFVNFGRIVVFGEKLNFLQCPKCTKIFHYDDTKRQEWCQDKKYHIEGSPIRVKHLVTSWHTVEGNTWSLACTHKTRTLDVI